MKRIITFGLAIMLAFVALAQNNVTLFLGIPIDGTKNAMIQKLKAKGYTYNSYRDCLEGEFNGRNVRISIVTNNNKVWRIMVADAQSLRNESDIRIRFNTLCMQFSKNGKYIPANLIGDYTISEGEDISYEMTVRDKRYEAAYYQITDANKDTAGFRTWAIEKVNSKYTEEEREKMSEEDEQQAKLGLLMDYISEKISKKLVWFMISREFGGYSIVMYYDNEYNKSNGEDL